MSILKVPFNIFWGLDGVKSVIIEPVRPIITVSLADAYNLITIPIAAHNLNNELVGIFMSAIDNGWMIFPSEECN